MINYLSYRFLVENAYPTVMYQLFHFYDVFIVDSLRIYLPTKWPPNFKRSTRFTSENPMRTPREPQENLKRTPREPQEKQICKRHLTWEILPTHYLYQENPKRTPREPQENPKRTPRERHVSFNQVISKKNLKNNETRLKSWLFSSVLLNLDFLK